MKMCIRDRKYYASFYNKDNLPAKATRTWVTKTIAETDSDGTTHYITKLADAYKVSGDSFYMQDGKAVFPLGTLTVEETKAPNSGSFHEKDNRTPEQEELIRLRKENQQLRMENDILKQAALILGRK